MVFTVFFLRFLHFFCFLFLVLVIQTSSCKYIKKDVQSFTLRYCICFLFFSHYLVDRSLADGFCLLLLYSCPRFVNGCS